MNMDNFSSSSACDVAAAKCGNCRSHTKVDFVGGSVFKQAVALQDEVVCKILMGSSKLVGITPRVQRKLLTKRRTAFNNSDRKWKEKNKKLVSGVLNAFMLKYFQMALCKIAQLSTQFRVQKKWV